MSGDGDSRDAWVLPPGAERDFGPPSPPTTACPKCRRPCAPGESACARCGLLVTRFERFASDGDPPELEVAWRGCCEEWSSPAAHDRALSVATRSECLPQLARRYRERIEYGADPVAEKRLQQIAVLIETAIRAQAKATASAPGTRAVWILGYVMAGAMLLASVWVVILALRHHG